VPLLLEAEEVVFGLDNSLLFSISVNFELRILFGFDVVFYKRRLFSLRNKVIASIGI